MNIDFVQGAVYSPAITDFVVMVEGSSHMVCQSLARAVLHLKSYVLSFQYQ